MKILIKNLLIIVLAAIFNSPFTLLSQIDWNNQNSYILDSGTPHTDRYTQKVHAIGSDYFVASSNYGNVSYLELIKNADLLENYITGPNNFIIQDIDVIKDDIYFCGHYQNKAVIGRVSISDLINGNNICYFSIMPSSVISLTHIKAYYDNADEKHIVCLGEYSLTNGLCSCIVAIDANNNYTINALNNNVAIEEIKDIDITDKFVTTVSFKPTNHSNHIYEFVVRTYSKDYPQDISMYNKRIFDLTQNVYISLLDLYNDRYYIRNLYDDKVAVLSSDVSINDEDITDINIIDLQSLQNYYSAAIVHYDKDMTIHDAKYEENNKNLVIVERGFNPGISNYTEYEISLNPFATYPANAFYVPNYDVMNSISFFDEDKYVAAGFNPQTYNNCFHIKRLNYNTFNCYKSFQLNVIQRPTCQGTNPQLSFSQITTGSLNWILYQNINSTKEIINCYD